MGYFKKPFGRIVGLPDVKNKKKFQHHGCRKNYTIIAKQYIPKRIFTNFLR